MFRNKLYNNFNYKLIKEKFMTEMTLLSIKNLWNKFTFSNILFDNIILCEGMDYYFTTTDTIKKIKSIGTLTNDYDNLTGNYTYWLPHPFYINNNKKFFDSHTCYKFYAHRYEHNLISANKGIKYEYWDCLFYNCYMI